MSIEYFLLYQDGVHWQQDPDIVGCSSIENVCFRNFSGDEMGIVDEEGLYKTNLRTNFVGSLLYRMRIVGRMLVGLRGERNGEPDIVGYPSKRDAWHAHCQIMNHIHKM